MVPQYGPALDRLCAIAKRLWTGLLRGLSQFPGGFPMLSGSILFPVAVAGPQTSVRVNFHCPVEEKRYDKPQIETRCIASAICPVSCGRASPSPAKGLALCKEHPTANHPKPSSDDIIALREAFMRGGLREVAKLKGHYITQQSPLVVLGQFDIETLTKNSAAVIVGRFTKKLDPRLLDDKVIFTDYEAPLMNS